MIDRRFLIGFFGMLLALTVVVVMGASFFWLIAEARDLLASIA